MKYCKVYFFLLFFMSTIWLSGQDTHFTNYHFTPLTVNPAFTGSFYGSYRIGGIYKDNYTFAKNANGYHTINVFADSPIIKGFRSIDWIGIGVETNQFSFTGSTKNDERNHEKYSFNWTNFKISGSYHFSLNKKQSRVLTLGVQMNMSSINFNDEGLKNLNNTRYSIATGLADPDMTRFLGSVTQQTSNSAQARANYRDFSTGLLFIDKTKTREMRFGFALEGITRPEYAGRDTSRANASVAPYRKPLGLHIHGEYEMILNKTTRIIPAVYYYSLGVANALNVNGRIKYLVNPEKDVTLVGGAGLRNFRQAIVLFGAEFGNYQLGGSIDFDLTESAIASGGFHGFEIGLIYKGLIHKKPKTTPIILCPRI
jgi:type IX secretion system PorP/SprF family membrane protein